MVKAWLSMNDEDREQAHAMEPSLQTLLLALQDVGCSDVIAHIQAACMDGSGATEHGTVEDSNTNDDPNVTKGAASARLISREVPKLSSDTTSNIQELEAGKNLINP